MKDEIKEKFYSLEELKRTIDCYDGYLDNEEVYYYIGALRFAYDYITNLQTIEQQYSAILSENAELENKLTNLQEENKKIKNKLEDEKKNYKRITTYLQEEIRRKDNIIYDLEDFIKEIMKATNKKIISVETAEIIYNKLKDLQEKGDEYE